MGKGFGQRRLEFGHPLVGNLPGGCLLKSLGAGKGNLADANIDAWPQTVSKLKVQYPDANIIVPGHGNPGGRDLLDFTITLFKEQ